MIPYRPWDFIGSASEMEQGSLTQDVFHPVCWRSHTYGRFCTYGHGYRYSLVKVELPAGAVLWIRWIP